MQREDQCGQHPWPSSADCMHCAAVVEANPPTPEPNTSTRTSPTIPEPKEGAQSKYQTHSRQHGCRRELGSRAESKVPAPGMHRSMNYTYDIGHCQQAGRSHTKNKKRQRTPKDSV
mmetsp:Transcript_36170/g.69683  ORF Transcript_36170/g.69683 Transcript_36170/m.69683 type:complete len:116 (-) Transcript_36170:152-499(-)